VTLMFYEHSLSLGEEIELIWLGRWSVLSAFVLADLYMREIGMLFVASVISGFVELSMQMCTSLMKFILFYGVLSTASIHTIILFRVYTLWDDRKNISYALMGGFVVCFGATVVFVVLAGIQLIGGMRYVAEANTCSFEKRSWYLTGAWSPMVLYDLYVLLLLCVNVLSRPRKTDSQLAMMLYRDGFLMFLGFFALRVARLLPSTFSGAEDVLIIPLITWALDGVLARRLFLRVKYLESDRGNVYLWHSPPDDPRSPVSRLAIMSNVQVWEEVEMHLL